MRLTFNIPHANEIRILLTLYRHKFKKKKKNEKIKYQCPLREMGKQPLTFGHVMSSVGNI